MHRIWNLGWYLGLFRESLSLGQGRWQMISCVDLIIWLHHLRSWEFQSGVEPLRCCDPLALNLAEVVVADVVFIDLREQVIVSLSFCPGDTLLYKMDDGLGLINPLT